MYLENSWPSQTAREPERNKIPAFSLFWRRAPILLPRSRKHVDSPEKPRCGHLRCEQSDSSFHTELLLCRRIGFLAIFTRSQEMETPPIWWPHVLTEMGGKGSSTPCGASTFHVNEVCLPVRPFCNNQTVTHPLSVPFLFHWTLTLSGFYLLRLIVHLTRQKSDDVTPSP